jgi:predicted nucleotidyltransferase
MKEKLMKQIPQAYQEDINTAVNILTTKGCKEVYLFGSLVKGEFREDSDIDLAVKGLNKGSFFEVLGKLIMRLNHPVDLIDLDKDTRFVNRLKREGNLLRVV